MLLLGGLGVGLWLGQERIIGLFVAAINRQLRTTVRVGHFDLSWWQEFPRVSVSLYAVRLQGSLPQDTTALARLQAIHCAFNAWDVLGGRYSIRTVTLQRGAVNIRRNQAGEFNYLILRPDSASTEPMRFAVEQMRLQDVTLRYADSTLRQAYTVQAYDVKASVEGNDQQLQLRAAGPMQVAGLRLGPDTYFRNQDLLLSTVLRVDRARQMLTIEPSSLRIGEATYAVQGTVGWAGPLQLDVRAEGQNTDLPGLLALLPRRLQRPLAAYRSGGQVYFRSAVKGELSARHNPRVDVQFGCRDASFYHPDTEQRIEHVFLTGSFHNGRLATARTAELRLQDVRGRLGNRPFSGSLRYTNLRDPDIALRVAAELNVADVLRFHPVAAVQAAGGSVRLKGELKGKLRAFRQNPARAALSATGDMQLRGVSLRLRRYLAVPLTRLSGELLLRRNDVAVTNLSGRLGRSDFQLNGLFHNALAWALLPRQPLHVEADATARYVDADELLRAMKAPAGKAGAVTRAGGLPLPAGVDLAVNAHIERLRFRRLRARAIRGTVNLRNQLLTCPQLTVRAAGGEATLRGTVDARRPELLKVSAVTSCRQLRLDSLFYVFEDFGQDFIRYRQLRGQLTGTAEADVYLNAQLEPLPDRLEAEVRGSIRHGELLDFAPAQRLSMLASREQLRHLRFDELTNTLYVQSRTVYIPEMEIRSNVRRAAVIRLTGTHTFDQQMDYHLTIPLLPGLRRPAFDVAAGGVVTRSGPEVRLRVWGSEDNFRVGPERARPDASQGRTATAATTAAATTAAPSPTTAPAPVPARPRSWQAPAPKPKKPAQPQPGEYFEF
ncbi:AsmA-like C-terminal region-containing protein [Hymenobacter sp. CRA2]|uniref:AsmA-like C-terminal region-containing protein n=1 Tax=Hymenobacter sp. CRA2 TaxID=1955620 RepID=UPI001592697C|nr:AsmA-like C-terminal region-containing protein [Hymenobacter sp. CRA2]